MIILKFAMVFFLFYLFWFSVELLNRASPKGGPFYYTDVSPIGVNPIQPEYRIDRQTAMHMKHALKVYTYNDGAPWQVSKLQNGFEVSTKYYFIDGYGRLRY